MLLYLSLRSPVFFRGSNLPGARAPAVLVGSANGVVYNNRPVWYTYWYSTLELKLSSIWGLEIEMWQWTDTLAIGISIIIWSTIPYCLNMRLCRWHDSFSWFSLLPFLSPSSFSFCLLPLPTSFLYFVLYIVPFVSFFHVYVVSSPEKSRWITGRVETIPVWKSCKSPFLWLFQSK